MVRRWSDLRCLGPNLSCLLQAQRQAQQQQYLDSLRRWSTPWQSHQRMAWRAATAPRAVKSCPATRHACNPLPCHAIWLLPSTCVLPFQLALAIAAMRRASAPTTRASGGMRRSRAWDPSELSRAHTLALCSATPRRQPKMMRCLLQSPIPGVTLRMQNGTRPALSAAPGCLRQADQRLGVCG